MASSVFVRGIPVLEYLYEITQFDVRVNQGALSDENRMKFTVEIKSMLQTTFCKRSYGKSSSSFFVEMQKTSFKSFKNQVS